MSSCRHHCKEHCSTTTGLPRFVPPALDSNTPHPGTAVRSLHMLTIMREYSPRIRTPVLDCHIPYLSYVPVLVESSPPAPAYRSTEKRKKSLRKMPKSSSLSLAMRSKGGKENASTPLSPLSPTSPNLNGGDPDAVSATGSYHDMPASPASPKPRKDSKSIFSNFSATRSSSRITNVTNPENSSRQVPDSREAQAAIYVNGRSGTSTPDLSRPVHTPNSDGKSPSLATSRGDPLRLRILSSARWTVLHF